MVVGKVRVDDVERFPQEGVAQTPAIGQQAAEAVGAGEERPRRAQRPEAARQVAAPDERELRFDAGCRQSLCPVPDDGRRTGPLLGGDDVEDSHVGRL